MASSTHRLGPNFRDVIGKMASLRLSDVGSRATTDYAEIIVGDGVPSGAYGRASGVTMVYLRKDASSVDAAVYVTVDGGTSWMAMQTSAPGGTQTDLILAPATELTIAAGAVAAVQGAHTIDTEADAASDDLTTITGGTAEELLVIRPANAARTVVVKHGIGANLIACPNGQDVTLAEVTDFALLYNDGTQWVLVGSNVLAGQPLVADTVTEKTAGAGVTLDGLLVKDGLVSADFLVKATIAVPDVGAGGTNAALTLALKRLDNSTALGSARQVLIVADSTQYRPWGDVAAVGSVTFSVATVGSIIATAAGWALVETDATGAFACTVANADDETVWFSTITAPSVSDLAKACQVVGSNADSATWSA